MGKDRWRPHGTAGPQSRAGLSRGSGCPGPRSEQRRRPPRKEIPQPLWATPMFIPIVSVVLCTFFKTHADMRLLRHLASYGSVSEGKGILVSTGRQKSVTSQSGPSSIHRERHVCVSDAMQNLILLAKECVWVKFRTFGIR